MIPGALTALQPIDMESYEMESPELTGTDDNQPRVLKFGNYPRFCDFGTGSGIRSRP